MFQFSDEPTGRLALVFELMERNMYENIKDRKSYLPSQRIKSYIFQLLRSIDHMHKLGIFHRDIKPWGFFWNFVTLIFFFAKTSENILLVGEHMKLADFGSCKGIYSKLPYTEYISTRWYRPPECLLTDGYYSFKVLNLFFEKKKMEINNRWICGELDAFFLRF